MALTVSLFFRRPRPGFYSIEGVFKIILDQLPKQIQVESFYTPSSGASLMALFKNTIWAKQHAGAINHITGDVNYLVLGLPAHNTILTLHDLESLGHSNPVKKLLLEQIWLKLPLAQVRAVTVISAATREVVVKKTNIDTSKIHVIPNPISPAYIFYPKEFTTDKPVVLQMGTKVNKNLERLITALKGIPCHLRIIGQLKPHQLELINKYNIDYSSVFDLSFQQVIEEYCQSDLVSLISLYEGFGMPIVEAQAIGRAVITSNCSSMPEVAGEGAFLVDPTSVAAIRQGILKLIEDEALRKDLIQKGLKNVKRFDAKVIAEQYAALYRKIAAENA